LDKKKASFTTILSVNIRKYIPDTLLLTVEDRSAYEKGNIILSKLEEFDGWTFWLMRKWLNGHI